MSRKNRLPKENQSPEPAESPDAPAVVPAAAATLLPASVEQLQPEPLKLIGIERRGESLFLIFNQPLPAHTQLEFPMAGAHLIGQAIAGEAARGLLNF